MIKKEDLKGIFTTNEKKIRKYGYEYTLVRSDRETNAFGFPGYVLKSFKKIDGSK